MGANISADEGESLVPRPLSVITGLDPVIHLGTHIVRRGMAGSSPAMTIWQSIRRGLNPDRSDAISGAPPYTTTAERSAAVRAHAA